MIAQGFLVVCVIAATQAFFLQPRVPIHPPQPMPFFPIYHKPMVHHKTVVQKKFVPVYKKVKVPFVVTKEVKVPIYIDREYLVPVGGGGGSDDGGHIGGRSIGGGSISGGSAGPSSVDFGINAQISDADTVNIHAGVGGPIATGGFNDGGFNDGGFNDGGFNDNSLNDLNLNDFNNNDGGFIGGSGGVQGLSGFDSRAPASIDISQTSISSPSAVVSKPKIGGHGGHKGSPKISPATHHF